MGAPLIFALTLLAAPQRPVADVSQRQVDASLGRAVAWLVESGLQQASRQGEQALAVYAAIHGGADPSREEFRALAESWRLQEFSFTYDTACVICALTEIDANRYFPTILRATKTLADWQATHGDWGYPSNPDLSNTQYGALGLWKAASLGIEIPATTWQALAERVLDYQDRDGGFAYRAGSGSTSINMTVAGAGTLALCEQQLRLADLVDGSTQRRLASARARGIEVLADQIAPHPSRMNWPLYGLYGMERLGAWSGMTHVGSHDWYQRGASTLLSVQRENGSWGSLTETCFAVLFLSRATAGVQQGVAFTKADDERTQRKEDPQAWCWLEVEGNGPSVTVGVERWNWNRLRAVEFPAERGRGPHVRYVEYWLDGERVEVQLMDHSRPILNQRFKKEIHVRERGEHELELRFHLELPPGATGENGKKLAAAIHSQRTRFVTLWNSERPRASLFKVDADGRPLLPLTATASSKFAATQGYPKGSHAARAAFDQDLETAWLARHRDRQRWLKARFPKQLLIKKVRLLPAFPVPDGNPLQRPRLVELRFDGEHRQVLIMPKDGSEGICTLSPAIHAKEVEIVVKTLYQDEPDTRRPFGFSEVEFVFLEEAEDE